MLLEPLQVLVPLAHHLQTPITQDLVPVRDRPRRPPGVQMTRAPARQLGRQHSGIALAPPVAHKQDQAAGKGNALDDLGRAAQVRRRGLEIKDMDALPHAGEVARVARVPARRVVAHVRLRGQQQLERDVLGERRVPQQVRLPEGRPHRRPQRRRLPLHVHVGQVVGHEVVRRRPRPQGLVAGWQVVRRVQGRLGRRARGRAHHEGGEEGGRAVGLFGCIVAGRGRVGGQRSRSCAREWRGNGSPACGK
jgi:hypothetical protein